MNKSSRIAVIGSGIAGLGAAWLLSRAHWVTLFEKNGYIGGHSHTVDAPGSDGTRPVDTGFIVYNERNYPQLSALFDHLHVTTRPTGMSFSASIDQGRIEYAGTNLRTLFAQPRNAFRPRFLRMIADILRFNRETRRRLAGNAFFGESLGEFLEQGGFGPDLADHYLLPMGAAIWSCPTEQMRAFPMASFARFFHNHGLLDLHNRPQWRTVVGGSHRYVQAMLGTMSGQACTDQGVRSVRPEAGGVTVTLADGSQQRFDQVVIAAHADQALAMLADPEPIHRRLLGSFGYQSNDAWLHGDEALMPRRRAVWSAWNYLATQARGTTDAVSVSYWMNRLQGIEGDPYFVSLNPLQPPAEDRVHARMTYDHPVFDARAMTAQKQLHQLQGRGGIWFCGSYFGYGFHEDALQSAVRVASALGVETPWSINSRGGEP